MENYEALKLDNQLCFPLYAASREVIRQYYPFLEKIGLTYTQYVAMMVLWEEEKITARDLGKRLFLDSGTLTPLLKALEKKGLIRKKRSEEDERVVTVELTAEGRSLKEQAVEVPGKIAGCIQLEPGEAFQLYRILYKILGKEIKI